MPPSVAYRPLQASDLPSVSALHDEVFGPGRFSRTAYRVREQRGGGALLVSQFCHAATLGDRLIASVTLTPIHVGAARDCLLLGPLAVDPEFAGQGYGRGLVGEAVDAARKAGMKAIILVGDEPYYARFGFKRIPPGQITFPGPVDQGRILGLDLQDGALADVKGLVSAA